MPSITSWTRLEPRCRDADMQLTVNARIFDPLWMLTRQWQMGEYRGEDAGSPVSARVGAETALLSRCHLGELPPNTAVTAARYDPHALPLEVMVERQRVRPAPAAAQGDARKVALAVETGLHFLRMLDLLLPPDVYHRAFIALYALTAPDEVTLAALDAETRAFIDTMAGRAPDGRRLEAAFRSAGPGAVFIDPALKIKAADRAEVELTALRWLAWAEALFSEPSTDARTAWLPERLEYAVTVAGRLSDDPFDEFSLTAAEVYEGHLDWSDFDLNREVNLGTAGDRRHTTLTQTVIPAPVNFRGAPAVRFWEFEDARVDYTLMPVGPTDLAQLLLIEYASGYGNDWYLIPLDLPVGSITRVRSLVVTDTFGVRLLHRPIGDRALPRPNWSMFQLAHTAGVELGPQSNLLFLAPALGGKLESPAREEVLLMRDEMANMAWAIERAVESPLERAVRRDDPASAAAAPAPALPARPDGFPYYDLSSDVPAHWVPLLPVQVPLAAGQVLTRLKRGAVLVADGSQEVRHALGEILNTGSELLLHDEEVPREGARVTRHYELARWIDGSTLLWASRRKQVGRGEGSSGLRYDRIVEPDAPSP
jgi:hypothetical protein